MTAYFNILKILLLTFLYIQFQPIALANQNINQKLVESYKHYKVGDYPEAIKSLKKIKLDIKLEGIRNYWIAICYNRLQQFDKSIKYFQKAIKLPPLPKDFYYEYGQALYANNDLNKARISFAKSYKLSFSPDSSLYYMGHISQILEEFKRAKKYYSKLSKLKTATKRLKQVASFQLAEVLLSMAEKRINPTSKVKKYILPQFKRAINKDPKSPIANDIRRRELEIKRKYGLDPNFMINGRRLPKKRYQLTLSQKFTNDDNITLATDLPTTQATQKESFISYSEFWFRYKVPIKQRYIIVPQLRLTNTQHSDRVDSSVFKNDSYNISPSIRSTLEHKAFGKMASMIFDIDYIYVARDRESKYKKIFYGRSTTFTLGERFNFFSNAETTIRYKFKNYDAYDENLSNSTNTISIDQMNMLKNRTVLITLFQVDYTKVKVETNSTISYLLRFDHLWPNISKGFTLTTSFAFTLLDTMKQRDTRGYEQTYAPGIKLTKAITPQLDFNIYFDYTKNISKNDQAYQYEKQTSSFEFYYKF